MDDGWIDGLAVETHNKPFEDVFCTDRKTRDSRGEEGWER